MGNQQDESGGSTYHNTELRLRQDAQPRADDLHCRQDNEQLHRKVRQLKERRAALRAPLLPTWKTQVLSRRPNPVVSMTCGHPRWTGVWSVCQNPRYTQPAHLLPAVQPVRNEAPADRNEALLRHHLLTCDGIAAIVTAWTMCLS